MMRTVAKRRLNGGENRPDVMDTVLPRENKPNFCEYSNEKNTSDYLPLVDEYFAARKRLDEISRKLSSVGINPEKFTG